MKRNVANDAVRRYEQAVGVATRLRDQWEALDSPTTTMGGTGSVEVKHQLLTLLMEWELAPIGMCTLAGVARNGGAERHSGPAFTQRPSVQPKPLLASIVCQRWPRQVLSRAERWVQGFACLISSIVRKRSETTSLLDARASLDGKRS